MVAKAKKALRTADFRAKRTLDIVAGLSPMVKVFRCGPRRDGGGWGCVGPR
ncbi:hypothetical protein SJ05684_b52490 (plasmid) [Sinorhizobium sojae CCBAU 05684]|uniref:Uncharacterized protein n=1 Tax=Sinorhizobium sojae CCBAU 05684 TaxID=716928 RepID=A0A249PJZ8_9HYPH|nr:hypothetical protein SJ05684_b52490 [Sinorhizobium sojae CCBAU 05684]